MRRAAGHVVSFLQLVAVVVLIACAIAGCGYDRSEQRRVMHDRRQAQVHIVPPLRPVVDDLDKQLSHATAFGIAATGLSAAGLVFVCFAASAFLRMALAVFASCLVSTVLMFSLRLSVPILAIALPWFMGACLIAGLIAAWLWYKHQTPVRLKCPTFLKKQPPSLFTTPPGV